MTQIPDIPYTLGLGPVEDTFGEGQMYFVRPSTDFNSALSGVYGFVQMLADPELDPENLFELGTKIQPIPSYAERYSASNEPKSPIAGHCELLSPDDMVRTEALLGTFVNRINSLCFPDGVLISAPLDENSMKLLKLYIKCITTLLKGEKGWSTVMGDLVHEIMQITQPDYVPTRKPVFLPEEEDVVVGGNSHPSSDQVAT